MSKALSIHLGSEPLTLGMVRDFAYRADGVSVKITFGDSELRRARAAEKKLHELISQGLPISKA